MNVERNSKAAALLVASVGGAVLASGTAYAYWSTTGAGTGQAAAGTMQEVTVSAGTAGGTALYPGLTANGTSTGGTLVVSASNPNAFPVTVTVTSAGATGCTTPAVSIPAAVTASFTLPPNSGTVTRTLTNVVSMGTDASNDCQGKPITLALSTTAISGS